MAEREKVECDHCGLKAPVLADGTYGMHRYTQYGRKVECQNVGQPRATHYGTFTVSQRDENGRSTQWVCNCRCARAWIGATYDDVDQAYTDHLTPAEVPHA